MKYFKKIYCMLMISFLVWSCFPHNVQAENVQGSESAITFENITTTTNGPAYDDDE